MLPRESKIGCRLDYDFRGRVDEALVQQMASDGFASAVAGRDVQMASIGGYRAGKADNFKVPGCSTAIRDIGKSNVVVSQRTHAGRDPPRFDLVDIDEVLD